MMTVLHYLLSVAVLLTLVATLMYASKAIKAKDDKSEKTASVKKATVFFLSYLLLNALRMYLESGAK